MTAHFRLDREARIHFRLVHEAYKHHDMPSLANARWGSPISSGGTNPSWPEWSKGRKTQDAGPAERHLVERILAIQCGPD